MVILSICATSNQQITQPINLHKYEKLPTVDYPPPGNGSNEILVGENSIFLPSVIKPWQYGSIDIPNYSISIYVTSFDNGLLYNAGCAQGDRDKNLAGVQNSKVLIHLGQPWYDNEDYGVLLHNTYDFKTVNDISQQIIEYAHGYWQCTGSDTTSHVKIAISTSNYSTAYTSYAHGNAWAEMVRSTSILLQQTDYYTQVDVSGGSNMELGFNSPELTREWVEGYDDAAYDPVNEELYRLYNFGDAAGCPPYGSCGTQEFPDWTQEDIWYISYGCLACYPIPLIYSNDWTQAEQWQQISKYSVDEHGVKILFQGSTTQYQACQQRWDPSCSFLDNLPEEVFAQLYTVLNSDPATALQLSQYKWSTDMNWWGE